MVGWFTTGYIYYGILFILPETVNQDYGKEGNLLDDILITTLFEFPGQVILIILIDSKWFARVNTFRLF